MKMQISQMIKELVLTTHTYGAVTKKGYAFDVTNQKKREIDVYTVVKVQGFNFLTKKIQIECVKGMEVYQAEVDIHFLVTHCQLTTPDPNQEVGAVMIQHITHNLLDKDTALFIVILTLTYLVGMVLGKGL